MEIYQIYVQSNLLQVFFRIFFVRPIGRKVFWTKNHPIPNLFVLMPQIHCDTNKKLVGHEIEWHGFWINRRRNHIGDELLTSIYRDDDITEMENSLEYMHCSSLWDFAVSLESIVLLLNNVLCFLAVCQEAFCWLRKCYVFLFPI